MDQDNRRFAEALEGLRSGRRLSQAQLARDLDVSENDISRWLRGRGISIKNVRKVADYFGVERTWLEQLAGYGDDLELGPKLPVQTELQARLTRLGTTLSEYPRAVWLAVLEANERMAEALAATLSSDNAAPEHPINRPRRMANGAKKFPGPVITPRYAAAT